MARSVAGCLILALLLGSGRLLACEWECGDAVITTTVDAGCHDESPDSGARFVGGFAHECPSEAIEPIATATNKAQKQTIGASQAPRQSISHALPPLRRLVTAASARRASAPDPPLITVLRI